MPEVGCRIGIGYPSKGEVPSSGVISPRHSAEQSNCSQVVIIEAHAHCRFGRLVSLSIVILPCRRHEGGPDTVVQTWLFDGIADRSYSVVSFWVEAQLLPILLDECLGRRV